MIDYEIFTKKWLERAQDTTRPLDEGDQFICLWISFNGLLKSLYGEHVSDSKLIRRVKEDESFIKIYDQLKEMELKDLLFEIKKYQVYDSRDHNNKIEYKNTYESLINVLY